LGAKQRKRRSAFFAGLVQSIGYYVAIFTETVQKGRPVCPRLKPCLSATALVLVLFAASALPMRAAPLLADSPITVTKAPAVANNFPNELTFTVSAKDTAAITDIVLHYTLLPEGSSVNARAEFEKGTDVQATYHMRSNGNPLYLPPGKDISYSWQMTDANGGQLTTDPQTVTYADTRFQWQTVTSGNLSLSFYKGNSGDARNLLGIGRAAIDKASQLEKAEVTFPVKLFAYTSSQDFLTAAQKESKATDPGILGQALTPDTVIFVADSLRSADTEDTVRHELTHLVTGQAVKGGFANLLPLWLNEGTSVYSQADPGDFARALQRSIANDSVVPIQVLESSRGVDVGLFYGESYGLVKYLVASGGQAKFAQLLSAIQSGQSMDQALKTVYGFDRTGLYNVWRDSVHLSGAGSTAGAKPPAAGAPATAPAPRDDPASANPTTDTGASPSRGSGGGEVSDRGTAVLLITLGGSLVLLLLAGGVALGLMLSRRSRL
jgi:hypothetical protein